MAYTLKPEYRGHFKAHEDLSDKRYYLMKLLDENEFNICGADDSIYGILDDKPEKSQAAKLCVKGIMKCIAGDVVIVGNRLKSDNQGRAIPVALAADEDNQSVKITALTPAAQADDIISVEIT